MSRRLWRCRNPVCPVLHGASLGRLTSDHGLVIDPSVATFQAYFDTKKAIITCPHCGARREFRGQAIFSPGARDTAMGR